MIISAMKNSIKNEFKYVEEWDDFLDVFPHRACFLWAEHPESNQRPEWQTENRHLLSDRLITQGSFLYGVRFGAMTNYLMIDIDKGSIFHPTRDKFAIDRMIHCLEPLGIVCGVPIQSSYSEGIHLYLPFAIAQKTWAIAKAAESLLQSGGFKLQKGQCELFPNPRSATGRDYNGHRLPMQQGSYILNSDLEPCSSSRSDFACRIRLAENKNVVTEETVNQTTKAFFRQQPRKLRFSSQKFLNDLNADIEVGWTSSGQTNHILGRIAIREYVFFHALCGGSPINGERLASRICEVAEDLPGYYAHCAHRVDIVDRCLYYARCVEASKYYPYGGENSLRVIDGSPSSNEWNQKQAAEARERIKAAIADLRANALYPDGIRNRVTALKAYGISSNTLYKHTELWHVENELKPAPRVMFSPTQAEVEEHQKLEPAPRAVFSPTDPISLYDDLTPLPTEGGSNTEVLTAVGGSGGFSTGLEVLPPLEPSLEPSLEPPLEPPIEGVRFVLDALAAIRRRRQEIKSPPPPPPPPYSDFREGNTS